MNENRPRPRPANRRLAGGQAVICASAVGTQRIRHNGGHGLGMAIIRAIADAHGAALSASPRPQGGLDIAVTFP